MTESRKLFPFVLSSVLCLNLLSPVHENSLNTKYFLDSFLDFHDSVKESCAATLGSRYSWASISHEFFDEPADRQFFSWLQGFHSTGHAHAFLDTSRSKKMLLLRSTSWRCFGLATCWNKIHLRLVVSMEKHLGFGPKGTEFDPLALLRYFCFFFAFGMNLAWSWHLRTK